MATPGRQRADPVPLLSVVLTLWTDDPALAARADAAGVDRVGLDLERTGKRERQAGRGTWISAHDERDLARVGAALTHAALFARCEAAGPLAVAQASRLADAGVEVVMLPYFTRAEEVAAVAEVLAGRALLVPLVETVAAAHAIEEILAVEGVGEIHVGLNDLTLELGLGHRFAALTHPLVEQVAGACATAGARLGLGGIGRPDDTGLPIAPELVYAQHARLGARAALLSRVFLTEEGVRLAADVAAVRAALDEWFARSPAELDDAARRLAAACEQATSW